MPNIYLNAGYDGTLYESSKEPKEGFDQHTSTKGNVSYRKTYKKGLYGFYKGMELRESKIGPQLSVHMVDASGNNVYLQTSFKDQKGDIGTFAESLLTRLPYMTADTLYRLYAYNMPVEGTTYSNIGISVKIANTWESVVDEPQVGRLLQTYTKKDGTLVQGHIPAIVWETTYDGKSVPNKKDKNNYLYNTLKTYGKIQEQKPATQAPPVAQQVATVQAPPPPVVAAPVVAPPVAAQAQLVPPPPVHPTAPLTAPLVPPPVQTQQVQAPPVAVVQTPPPPPPVQKPQTAPPAAQSGQPLYVAPPTSTALDDLPF